MGDGRATSVPVNNYADLLKEERARLLIRIQNIEADLTFLGYGERDTDGNFRLVKPDTNTD